MQQLFFVKKEKLEWREVPDPKINSGKEALVRPFTAAKCDLDDAFLFNNLDLKLQIGKWLKKVDPDYFTTFGNLLSGPFPFGHECVGEVIEIGDQVKSLAIGDVVSVPFQISCGECISCVQGHASACSDVPSLATYGFGKHLQFGGALSDVIKVPYADAMLVHIPKQLDPTHLASLSDNIPDAYRHVEDLQDNPDKRVLIISGKAKSVGLYTALLAKSMGVTHIDYADNNAQRIAIAQKIGVHQVFNSFSQIQQKYELVVDASSTQKGLLACAKHVAHYGTISSSGIYIAKTAMPLIEMYAKNVTFKTGLANARPDALKVLSLMRENPIDLSIVTTKLDTWDNAIDALLSHETKVIVHRDRKFTN